jgi:hypothetical protein
MRIHLLMLSKRMVKYCPFLASEVTLQGSFNGSSSGVGIICKGSLEMKESLRFHCELARSTSRRASAHARE